jgi:hypothetical protein
MLKFSLLKEKKEKSNDIRFFLNYLFIIWEYFLLNQWEQAIWMWNKSLLQVSCGYHMQIYLLVNE